MKKKLIAAVAAAAFLPLLASAQFAKTEDAIKYRQSALFIMGQHLRAYRRYGQRQDPVRCGAGKGKRRHRQCGRQAALGRLRARTATRATPRRAPEVWEDAGKFKAAQERLAAALPKLAAATETGDKAKIKDAFGEAAGACKNCHDSFRAK